MEHSGVYVCKISNSYGTIETSSKLLVYIHQSTSQPDSLFPKAKTQTVAPSTTQQPSMPQTLAPPKSTGDKQIGSLISKFVTPAASPAPLTPLKTAAAKAPTQYPAQAPTTALNPTPAPVSTLAPVETAAPAPVSPLVPVTFPEQILDASSAPVAEKTEPALQVPESTGQPLVAQTPEAVQAEAPSSVLIPEAPVTVAQVVPTQGPATSAATSNADKQIGALINRFQKK